jgi:hypothetical protein
MTQTTDMTDMTDMTDSTEQTNGTATEHIDSGDNEPPALRVRRRDAPVESTYPWNRRRVVIDADTHDECLIVLSEPSCTGRRELRSDTALHLASPNLVPLTRPACHQPLTDGDADAEPVAAPVSAFDAETITDRLCGSCARRTRRNLQSHFACLHDGDCTFTPRVVAERRIVFFHSAPGDHDSHLGLEADA